MNDNSSLRYLGEAYEGVRFHVEPLLAGLSCDTALRIYAFAAGVTIFGYMTVLALRMTRELAMSVKGTVRRS